MLCPEKLTLYISRFILEVWKKDGTEYPPNTLYHIVCGLMRHLHQNGMPDVDFFKEKAYTDLRTTLDAEVKRLKLLRIGATKRQAEILTEDEEELLWRGVLGYHSPKSLLNTVFFFNGVCFALRSGKEHCQLRRRRNRSQIQLVEKTGQRASLIYKKDSSKNNKGGLKGRKIKQREVVHHENTTDTQRCPVRAYRKYISLLPDDCSPDAFYFVPLKKPKPDCWYTTKPLGHNSLDNMVKKNVHRCQHNWLQNQQQPAFIMLVSMSN